MTSRRTRPNAAGISVAPLRTTSMSQRHTPSRLPTAMSIPRVPCPARRARSRVRATLRSASLLRSVSPGSGSTSTRPRLSPPFCSQTTVKGVVSAGA